MHTPRVTVAVPVYNGEKYLAETIASVLVQTFRDFELLLVDDSSTDRTLEAIREFDDPRIRLLRNEANMGISRSRNRATQEARGEYVCYLDSDDLCTPDRLEVQVRFMDSHPGISLCGSFAGEIDADGKVISGRLRAYPTEPEQVAGRLWSGYTILNPTIILRRRDFIENDIWQNPDFKVGGDYEFYVRAARKLKLANIPQVLLYYRQHAKQASIAYDLQLTRGLLAIQLESFRGFFPDWPEAAFDIQRRLSRRECDHSQAEVQSVTRYFTAMAEANQTRGVFAENDLEGYIRMFWNLYLRHITRHSPQTFLNLSRSPYFGFIKKRQKLKLLAKSMAYWREKPDSTMK